MDLKHPLTGQVITVPDDQSDGWKAMGWIDLNAPTEPAPSEPGDESAADTEEIL